MAKIQMSRAAPRKVDEFGENDKSDKNDTVSDYKSRHSGLVKIQNSKEMSKGAPWKVAILTNMAGIEKMANSAKICKRFSETFAKHSNDIKNRVPLTDTNSCVHQDACLLRFLIVRFYLTLSLL